MYGSDDYSLTVRSIDEVMRTFGLLPYAFVLICTSSGTF